jgi:hypothetical protein
MDNQLSLIVFDNGVQRVGSGLLPNSPQSDHSPTMAFDATRNIYARGRQYALSGSGFSLVANVPNGSDTVNFDGSHLFFYGGVVEDASSLTPLAQLIASGTYPYLYQGLGDETAHRAYYRGGGVIGSAYAIHIFDTTNFQDVAQIDEGAPIQFIHWDADKLAIVDGFGPFISPHLTFLKSPRFVGTTGNPRPAISSVTPDSSPMNGPDISITISGVNFVNDSQVRADGVPLQTSFVNSTQLSATVPTASLAKAGASYLTVLNPAGGESNQLILKVVPDSISLASLSPVAQLRGHLDFPVVVSGQNFTPDSVVLWNGSPRVTHFDSTTQLTATIKAADVATEGTASVSVSDWIAGSSNSSTFTVTSSAQATLSDSRLGFPMQRIGTISAPLTLTITNTGDAVLQINSITATSVFTTTTTCGSTLNAGASCMVNVTAAPTEITAYTGTLTLDTNSSVPAAPVTLFVIGGQSNFQAASSVSYSPQQVHLPSTSKFINISNQGNYPMAIQSVTITGDFRIDSNPCPATLNANFGCGINVSFRPNATGVRNGALVITTDAPGSPHTVTLSGTGIDISLAVSRSLRPHRNAQVSFPKLAQVDVSGHTSSAVHLSCDGLPSGVQCQFSQQDFALDGSQTIDVSLRGRIRASRLSPSASSPRSLRMGALATNSSVNVRLSATTDGTTKNIALTLPLP